MLNLYLVKILLHQPQLTNARFYELGLTRESRCYPEFNLGLTFLGRLPKVDLIV